MIKYVLPLILIAQILHGSIVGNPSAPRIFEKGLFFKNRAVDLRVGYYFSNIFRMKFKDEIITEESSISYLKLASQGTILSANIKRRCDIYTLLGDSKLKINKQVKTNNYFHWAVGAKLFLFQIANFDFTISGAYFRSKMDPSFFLIDQQVYPILTEHFGYLYEEYQAALAVSYRIKDLIPYVGATYLSSNTLTPKPRGEGLLRLPYPNQDQINDFFTETCKNCKNWGIVIGVSLITNEMIDLTIESRMIDQNAFNISSELRF